MQDKVLQLLKQLQISYEIAYHEAISTMAQMEELHLAKETMIAKNLFLRDDKKRNYYLICVHGDKKVDLKGIREILSSRVLSFASISDLEKILQLKKGSLTPFGILNDNDKMVKVYIDEEYKNTQIGIHPNVNTATVWLNTEDLMRVIRQHGNEVSYITID